MKKILLLLIFLITTSTAAANPSCVLMKFTDDTRFDLVESAASLSDLVMEKLIASGKFKLMETNPIEENIEIQLYNEKLRDLKFLEDAIKKSKEPLEIKIDETPKIEQPEDLQTDEVKPAENSKVEVVKTTEDLISVKDPQSDNVAVDEVKKITPPVIDLNPLFEGVGFDEKRAQSIATAQVGQFIDPEITSKIGKEHNADYLIQGTIINLGTGTWWNEDFAKLSNMINTFSSLSNTSIPLGMLGSVLSGVDIGKIGVGVQCDLRVLTLPTPKRARFTS